MQWHTEDSGLVELGAVLRETGYRFVTVTPETHAAVLKRKAARARDLRDVFGWSLPFDPALLPPRLMGLARDAGVLVEDERGLRSSVRFSSLGANLFVHSAYPTLAQDSVFFGPDTYRFCAFVERSVPKAERLVDLGCGSGAGGIHAARRAERVVLADVSPAALRFARVNAELAGERVEVLESDGLGAIAGPIDAVIANPPYLRDAGGRRYRDGGGELGEGLALRFVEEALERLSPGGRLVLYTGAAMVDGDDVFFRQAEPLCRRAGASMRYEELDPDVFGTELAEPAYAGVERLAAVGLIAVKND